MWQNWERIGLQKTLNVGHQSERLSRWSSSFHKTQHFSLQRIQHYRKHNGIIKKHKRHNTRERHKIRQWSHSPCCLLFVTVSLLGRADRPGGLWILGTKPKTLTYSWKTATVYRLLILTKKSKKKVRTYLQVQRHSLLRCNGVPQFRNIHFIFCSSLVMRSHTFD